MYSYRITALGAMSFRTWLDALREHEDVLIIFLIYTYLAGNIAIMRANKYF